MSSSTIYDEFSGCESNESDMFCNATLVHVSLRGLQGRGFSREFSIFCPTTAEAVGRSCYGLMTRQLGHVRLSVTLRTTAGQASLSAEGQNTRVGEARMRKWVAVHGSRRATQPRDRSLVSCVSCTGRRVLYHQCRLGSWRPYHQESNLWSITFDLAQKESGLFSSDLFLSRDVM